MKKLLIIGSNTIHTYNYINLIEDYFDDILLLTNKKNEKHNKKTIEIDFKLGFNVWNSAKKIKNIVKEFNPSIIHMQQANSYAFITLWALRQIQTPKVLTAWGSDVLINPKENIILKKMLEFSLNRIDIATSDSLYMASQMKIYNPNLDIRIANFGIEIGYEVLKKEKIIYTNRLHKSLYNIEKIIYSFNCFVQKNNDWKLVIGAIGDDTEKLKQLVSDLNIEDKVEFIGWVDSSINNQMYQKSKIYLSIPDSDATAISLLEAISNNCICFVSNIPANSEHILDGINGFIEPNLNDIELEKYQLINQDILEKVNDIRKESYLKDYNRENFIKIYDELLGEKINEKYTIS